MNYFLAVNDRQLGTCLRMLFAEGIQGIVQVVLMTRTRLNFISALQQTIICSRA